MKKSSFSNVLLLAMSIFTMTFGAGNVLSPLICGFSAGSASWLAILAFLTVSVFIPLLGLFAVMHHHGDYELFLSKYLGPIFGCLVTMLSMLLLGPTGCIPRCVMLAHSTLNNVVGIHPFWFSVLFLGLVYIFAMQKTNIIKVLGQVTGPLTLVMLAYFIIKGWLVTPSEEVGRLITAQPKDALAAGFYQGFFTFDLLAMIFYSHVVWQNICYLLKREGLEINNQACFSLLRRAAFFSTTFFVLVYSGLILVACKHASVVNFLGLEQLFAGYCTLLFTNEFRMFSSILVGLACFSATVALSTVFADYLVKIGRRVFGYQTYLFLCILVSLVLSNVQFDQIQNLMKTLIVFVYPILILISIFAGTKALFARSED